MSFHDGPHQAEPDPEPALRTTDIPAVQPFPDPLPVLTGDAWSRVDDVNFGTARRRSDLYGDVAAAGRVLDRVVDQIGDGLTDPDPVAGDWRDVGTCVGDAD